MIQEKKYLIIIRIKEHDSSIFRTLNVAMRDQRITEYLMEDFHVIHEHTNRNLEQFMHMLNVGNLDFMDDCVLVDVTITDIENTRKIEMREGDSEIKILNGNVITINSVQFYQQANSVNNAISLKNIGAINSSDSDKRYHQHHLVPTNNKTYWEFIRWLNQNNVIEKIIVSPSVLSTCPNILPSSFFNYLFRLNSVPIKAGRPCCLIAWADVVTRFFSGANYIINAVYPALFYAALAHDAAYYYRFPDERYSSSESQVWFGTSQNTHFITSYWGNDIAYDYRDINHADNYMLAPAVVMAMPIIVGGISALIGRFAKKLNVNDLVDGLQYSSTSWLADTFRWFNPLPLGRQGDIDQTIFALKWTRLSARNQRKLLDALINIAKTHNSLTQSQVIYALGEIANTYREVSREFITRVNDVVERHRLKSTEKKILHALDRLSNKRLSLQALYTKHVLWQHGYQVAKRWQFVFLLKTTMWLGLLWYCKALLAGMIIQRILGMVDFIQKQKDCMDADKIYHYIDQWAQYVCEICPDWEDVYLGDIKTSQGCLNGLLAKERFAVEIIEKMDRLLQHPDFTDIDFSKQNLLGWLDDDWQLFLNKISASKNELNIFNLSRAILSPPWLPTNKFSQFANFMNRTRVTKVDLHNQNLGPTILKKFITTLHTPGLSYLDLSYTALDDGDAENLAQLIVQSHVDLVTLNLQGNKLTDKGAVTIIAAVAHQPKLTALDLSDNFCRQKTIDAAASAIMRHNFTMINLSGNDFSNVNLTPLWAVLANTSNVQALYLDRTHLQDGHLVDAADYLAQWSMQRISLADIDITIEGLDFLFEGLGNNTIVEQIYLDNNSILDAGLAVIRSKLHTMAVTDLSLNNCGFSTQGFVDFTATLRYATKLKKLSIAKNKLDNPALIALIEEAANYTLPIEYIDASSNNFNDESGVVFAKMLPHTNFVTAILSNNRFGDRTAIKFSATLSVSSLKTLIIDQNEIKESGVNVLANVLPESHLIGLDISNNPARNGIKQIAQQLITSAPHLADDDQKEISINARRALYQAKPNTKLQTLKLFNTEIDNPTAREICRILPKSGIPFSGFYAAPNHEVTDIDLENCRFYPSSATQLSPLNTYYLLYEWWHYHKVVEQNAVSDKNLSVYQWAEDNTENIAMIEAENFALSSPVMLEAKFSFARSRTTLFLPGSIDTVQSNQSTEKMSAAFLLAGVIPIINSLVLLYVLYRMLSPLINTIAQKSENTHSHLTLKK